MVAKMKASVAFFLTPKDEVVWIPADDTVGQALERMRARRFTAVPILDGAGRYVATMTEGDILWHLVDAGGDWTEVAARTPVLAVARRMTNHPVHIYAEMDALVARAIEQHFVPVIDDRGVFVGIVRRQRLFDYVARPPGERAG
jgi:CBS domain-containing protein